MKINEIKAQVKALSNYISRLIDDLSKYNNVREKDDDSVGYLHSDRENYYEEGGESSKIARRYNKLRSELVEIFPDIFSDLMYFNSDDLRALDELERETAFILDTLDILESKNHPAFSQQKSFYDAPVNENEKSIEIVLDVFSTVIVVSSKLNSFDVIYSELCRLFNVSTTQFPLRIAHLEVGSIWAKLFGESRVIGLMTKFLEETGLYFYRNKTQEGRRKETSTKVNELRQLIDLESEMRKNGFDTSNLREDIEKATYKISQEYCNLVADSNSVSINTATFDFTDGKSRNLFANKKEPLLLENKEEKPE